jgi:hypothetical protein
MRKVCYLTLLFPASAPAALTTRTPKPSSLASQTALAAPAPSLENAHPLPTPTSRVCASPSAHARDVVGNLQGFVGGPWWIHKLLETIGHWPLDVFAFCISSLTFRYLNKRPRISSI